LNYHYGWCDLLNLRSPLFVLFNRYYDDNQIKEGEMGGACSAHGNNEQRVGYSILVGKPERDGAIRKT
jgi:hypothetical protein